MRGAIYSLPSGFIGVGLSVWRAQKLLLACSLGDCVVPGIEPGRLACRAVSLAALLALKRSFHPHNTAPEKG